MKQPDADLDIFWLKTDELAKSIRPFRAWFFEDILPSHVRSARRQGRFDARPSSEARQQLGFDIHTALFSRKSSKTYQRTRRYHIERIAYLAEFVDPTPIVIEATSASSFELADGHHRLCAAIVRGDPEIAASYCGFEGDFLSLFPAARKCTSIRHILAQAREADRLVRN